MTPINLDQLDQEALKRFVKTELQNPGGDIPLAGVQGLSQYIAQQQAGPRTLYGIADDSGVVVTGSGGFTSSNLAPGINQVFFDTPFPAGKIPITIFSAGGTAGVITACHFDAPAEDHFTVGTLDTTGAVASGRYHFLTIGASS